MLWSTNSAAIEFERPTLSGFGALVATYVEGPADAGLAFRRDDQTRGVNINRASLGTDSNLGLQMDWRLGTDLDVEAQGMFRRQDTLDPAWATSSAFARWWLDNSTSVRLGRLTLPVYMTSTSRWVSFAHHWIRPPQEVYGLALVQHVDGLQAVWDASPREGQLLRATAVAGKSTTDGLQDRLRVSQVKGLELMWSPLPDLRLHASTLAAQAHLPTGQVDRYSFHGVGMVWDSTHWITQAEFVMRRSGSNPQAIGASAWYAMAGRRIDKWLPYLGYAYSHSTGGLAGLTGRQSTLTAGLRWNLNSALAFKLQFDRTDLHGTQGVSTAVHQARPAGNAGAGGPTLPAVAGGSQPPAASGGSAQPPSQATTGRSGAVLRPLHVLAVGLDFVF